MGRKENLAQHRRSAACSSPTAARSRCASSAPAASSASSRSPSTPTPTATALHVPPADHAFPIGPAAAAESYLRDRQDPRRRRSRPAPTRSTPATASSPSAPPSPRAVRRGRPHLHRPVARGDRRHGRQGRGAPQRMIGRRRAGRARAPRTRIESDAEVERLAKRDRLPRHAEGRRRRRRQGHAARRTTRPELASGLRAARSEAQVGVRRRPRVRREGDHPPAPRRGAGPRRHARQRRPPLRARVLDPAPAPEGHRGVAVARHRPEDARGDGRASPCRRPRRSTTSAPGTIEFLVDQERRLLLPRDEHAHPGRAPDHRGGDRRRPGAGADRDRRRAGRCRCAQQGRRAARLGDRVPHLRRGPGEQLPPRARPHRRCCACRAASASATTRASTRASRSRPTTTRCSRS